LQASNRSRVLFVKDARHLRKDKDYRILQGLIRKTAKSFFKLWTEARTGGWRCWGAGVAAPATWRAGSSGKKGEMGRRQRGTCGAAHLGRRRAERWPAADMHGSWLGLPWAAALRRISGDGKRCSMFSSTRGNLWWHRFAPGGGGCDESVVAVAHWPAASGLAWSGGGARQARVRARGSSGTWAK
jgi:hypothetical protein